MAFNPQAQQRLLTQVPIDPEGSLRAAVHKGPPWDSIVDFACHRSFCSQRLYPRQATLLKLLFLETENMTAYDVDVVEGWRTGFSRHREVFGVQPDIWQRVDYLKARGYRRFPHVQMVLGRRASKGFLGGILGAEQLAYLLSLDDFQAHYGIRAGKECYGNIGATSQTVAMRQQFKDILQVVEDCAYLQPHIAEAKDHILAIRTPADLRRIAEMKTADIPIDHQVASLRVVPLSASSTSGRGSTSFFNVYDEFAHMIYGTQSVKSGSEIYEDWQPNLGQFKQDALTLVSSSPFCLEPSTRVLTEDLRWIPVGSIQEGDHLIGFDEHTPGGKGSYRKWRRAVVTESSIIHAPRYEIQMSSGKRIVCTGEHLWLGRKPSKRVGRGKNRNSGALTPILRWWKTSDLSFGDQIRTIGVDPWDTDDSRDAGYLAGFFDGEGHLSTGHRDSTGLTALGFSQNFGTTSSYVEKLLKERAYDLQVYIDRHGTMGRYRINGGVPEMLRFLGTVRPPRLLEKFPSKFYGGSANGRFISKTIDTVVSVRQVDDGPVVALGTSTNTLVAEGLMSHNTKVGKFYELYQHGKVLMSTYRDDEGISQEAVGNLKLMGAENPVELTAEPTWIIFQGTSYSLYEDWPRAREITSSKVCGRGGFKSAPEPDLTDEVQIRRRRRNPEKFAVERLGQFAEVMGQYLDRDKVAAMFAEPGWRAPLEAQSRGYLTHSYRSHCDPGRTGANFAMCVAHLEDAPPDEHGQVWPHVIVDLLKVWRPEDFPLDPETGKATIDYVQVQDDVDDVLFRFPSTAKVSFDQWNSAGMIAALRRKYSPGIRVAEVTFTEKDNQVRFERFKTALNLGWVHSYADFFYGDGGSLLEMELLFLAEHRGKVIKQDTGPVVTKDLADCLVVCTTDLLHNALDRYAPGEMPALRTGSTNVASLRSGREFDRLAASGKVRDPETAARNLDAIRTWGKTSREKRGGYAPSRASSIHARNR